VFFDGDREAVEGAEGGAGSSEVGVELTRAGEG
jgi:hypothetical protein